MNSHPRGSEIDPSEVIPFGRNGAGLFTAHPVGLIIVIGLLLMGLFGVPGAGLFFGAAFLAGGILGLLFWLRHR